MSFQVYHSEHSAECDNKLASMLFEAECEYALSEGYTHLADFTERMFALSRSPEGVITLTEVESLNKNTEESEEQQELCNACASLEALDTAILAHLTNTKTFNNDSSNTLLKLAQAKSILAVAHNA